MKLIYSEHIKRRIALRSIEYELPKKIFKESKDKYIDIETGHFIAVSNAELYKRNRDVMVAYDIEKDCNILLTIHPLKKSQKENRTKNGRWRKI